MNYFDKALADPAALFKNPTNLLEDTQLNREQKIRILKQWEYDARELQVAEEENMQGKNHSQLDLILKALHDLGVEPDVEHTPPTKQGGED